jgi:[NiFe] hydrogenase diaphorase moiety large subunit
MLVTEREQLSEDIRALADQFGRSRTALIPILQEIKKKHHHIDGHAMQVIADMLDIHPVEVHSVASFYSFLGSEPAGEFVLRLCRTISCDMNGKDRVARQLENDLGITFGETTARYTRESARDP